MIIMESLDFAGASQIFIGIYLIIHGLIHSLFLTYSLNSDTGTYTGWSGKSWMLGKFLSADTVEIVGKGIWILIILLFIFSGFAVLGMPYIKDYIELLIMISSTIAILSFFIFFDGFAPSPYNFLIGFAIDAVLLAYVLFFPSQQRILIFTLAVLFIIGMIWVFISDVLPLIKSST